MIVSRRFGWTRLVAGMACCWVLASAAVAQGAAPGGAPAGASGAPAGAPADVRPDQAHRAEDIARHRTMSAAHEAAARCLESGGTERACQEALRKACLGIAIGRYCGMRHQH